MADFTYALDKTIINEGGYLLHQVEGDLGGQTYAGISRRYHPSWSGWKLVEAQQQAELKQAVHQFYRSHFWQKIMGDDIEHQQSAELMFDFCVNAGCTIGVKLAQVVLGTNADGIMGKLTLVAINQVQAEEFKTKYVLAMIMRYTEIVNRNPEQKKFLLGWLNRALRSVS